MSPGPPEKAIAELRAARGRLSKARTAEEIAREQFRKQRSTARENLQNARAAVLAATQEFEAALAAIEPSDAP